MLPVSDAQIGAKYAAGGSATALNLIGPTVIKATAGRLVRIVISAGGSSGSFVINDTATIGAASAANELISIPSGIADGTVLLLEWPCANGITLSAVPAGSPVCSVSFW